MEPRYGFISADDHVHERPEVWTSRMSKQKWGDRIPHMETRDDGMQHWMIDDTPLDLTGSAIANSNTANRAMGPTRWDELPRAAYNASERLKVMDADGVDYSVLYPMVAGLAGERFGKFADADLELACVQAYNDWLIEEWARVSSRFVPQCIVPIWPMERTVAEIRRAVALGHKGVVYPASPMELKDVPHINEPAYDPLWAVCAELEVPLCFHSGASPKIQMRAGQGFTPAAALAFGGIVRSVSSIAVLANFLFSRVLYRFPKLKVVFAESSLGWGAYEMEYADYQSAADACSLRGIRSSRRSFSNGNAFLPAGTIRRACEFVNIRAAAIFFGRLTFRLRHRQGRRHDRTAIAFSLKFPKKRSS